MPIPPGPGLSGIPMSGIVKQFNLFPPTTSGPYPFNVDLRVPSTNYSPTSASPTIPTNTKTPAPLGSFGSLTAIVSFASPGPFTWTPGFTGNIQILVVGGGGAGGTAFALAAGGGGAGGVAVNPAYPVVAGTTYNVSVGAGGTIVPAAPGSTPQIRRRGCLFDFRRPGWNYNSTRWRRRRRDQRCSSRSRRRKRRRRPERCHLRGWPWHSTGANKSIGHFKLWKCRRIWPARPRTALCGRRRGRWWRAGRARARAGRRRARRDGVHVARECSRVCWRRRRRLLWPRDCARTGRVRRGRGGRHRPVRRPRSVGDYWKFRDWIWFRWRRRRRRQR